MSGSKPCSAACWLGRCEIAYRCSRELTRCNTGFVRLFRLLSTDCKHVYELVLATVRNRPRWCCADVGVFALVDPFAVRLCMFKHGIDSTALFSELATGSPVSVTVGFLENFASADRSADSSCATSTMCIGTANTSRQ